MAIKKIPCGGFSYDDSEIAFESGVIHPIGSGAMVVKITYDESTDSLLCNHTLEEIANAFPNIIFMDEEDNVGYELRVDDGAFLASKVSIGFNSGEETYAVFNGVDRYIIGESGVSFTNYAPLPQ